MKQPAGLQVRDVSYRCNGAEAEELEAAGGHDQGRGGSGRTGATLSQRLVATTVAVQASVAARTAWQPG